MNTGRTNRKSLSYVLDTEWRAATAHAPAAPPTLATRAASRRHRNVGYVAAGSIGVLALVVAAAAPALAGWRDSGDEVAPAASPSPNESAYPGAGSTAYTLRLGTFSDPEDPATLDGVLIVQASDSGRWASVTSIPLLTATGPITCPLTDGGQVESSASTYEGLFAKVAQTGDWAAAATCVTTALESDLGINFDGGLASDFAGYVTRLHEASPIHLCLATPARSEQSNLDLPAGSVAVEGSTALAYARSRSIEGADDSQAAQSERDAYVLAEALASLTEQVQVAAGEDPGPWLSGVHSTRWGKPIDITEMASYYGPEWTRIYFGTLPVTIDGDVYRLNDATKAWADAVRSSSPPPDGVTLASVDADC